jgi:hypothetical protein
MALERRANLTSNPNWRNAMMRRIATFVVIGLLVAVPALASPLEGKAFVGETAKKGETKGDPDTFSFKEGKFHSTGCDPYGFKPSPYKVEKAGDAWSFTSECISPKEGSMSWRGTVKGSAISGTVVWTKPGQAPIEYTFTGAATP